MKCPNCAQEIAKGFKFCPNCGTQIELSKQASISLGDVGMFKGDIDASVQQHIGQQTNIAGNVTIHIASAPVTSSHANWLEWMAQYVKIRDTEPPSPARTSKLDALVMQMIQSAPSAPPFDLHHALDGRASEYRLAAYAYLCARPDPALLDDLLTAVTEREDVDFCQYWGIHAIGKVLEHCPDVSIRIYNKLRRLLMNVKQGGNRYSVLSQILKKLEER